MNSGCSKPSFVTYWRSPREYYPGRNEKRAQRLGTTSCCGLPELAWINRLSSTIRARAVCLKECNPAAHCQQATNRIIAGLRPKTSDAVWRTLWAFDYQGDRKSISERGGLLPRTH